MGSPPPAPWALTVSADPHAVGENRVGPVPEAEIHHQVSFGLEDAPNGETVLKNVAGTLAIIAAAEPAVTRDNTGL